MDTATGLLAVIPVYSHLHSEHPLVTQALSLVQNAPEVNHSVLVEADEGPQFISSILEATKSAEKKEGERFRLVLVLNPSASYLSTENIMESFQRLIVDALSDGIMAVNEDERGTRWNVDLDGYLIGQDVSSVDALALWKRDILDHGFKGSKEFRVIPYPIRFGVVS